MKNFIALIILLFLLGCSYNNDPDSEGCLTVACTEEFRTITITVKYSNGTPVVFDSFKVIDIKNKNDLTYEGWQSVNGIYPIFSDKHAFEYQNKEIKIEFSGVIDNKKVVSEVYTVGANCCHVYLKEGKDELIIN